MDPLDRAVRGGVRAARRVDVPAVRGEHDVLAAVRVVGDRVLRPVARRCRGERAAAVAMRSVAAATLLAVLAACTPNGSPAPAPTPSTAVTAPVGPSAAAAIAKLCPQPAPYPHRIRPTG